MALKNTSYFSLYVLALLISVQLVSLTLPVEGLARRDDVINVHLVPHTHDDVGWLKTVDQYFVGSNQSIQRASVQNILDSVIRALIDNPARRFMYVESAFLWRWWMEQDAGMRDAVRGLVQEGRLELVNGGWCMHDEAAAYYTDMIDQTSLGHRFLLEELGAIPTIGWQIDPFGHSALQGYLMGAQLGFDGVFLGRIDFQDMERRRKSGTLEHVWRSSGSLPPGPQQDIWALTLGSGNYGPPPGFCFDEVLCADPPIQDDPNLEDYNVEERVEKFVQYTQRWATWFQGSGPGGDVMFTMGSDFQYSNAHAYFKQLDKLVKHLNRDGRLNVFYSTPSQYLRAKHSANITLELKTDDFFPYADNLQAYWTGYFTSRPALKGYVREASNLLQAYRQLDTWQLHHMGKQLGPKGFTDELERAMGTAQHHDAVSGTSKQHVANDYAKRLASGVETASRPALSVIKHLLQRKKGSDTTSPHPQDRNGRQFTRRFLGEETQPKHVDFAKHTNSDGLNPEIFDENHLKLLKEATSRLDEKAKGKNNGGLSGSVSKESGKQVKSVNSKEFNNKETAKEAGNENDNLLGQISKTVQEFGANLYNLESKLSQSKSPISSMDYAERGDEDILGELEHCHQLNISRCDITEWLAAPLPAEEPTMVAVVAYNPLAWSRTDVIRLPVKTTQVRVLGPDLKTVVPAQLVPLTSAQRKLRNKSGEDEEIYEIVFQVSVPPVGYATYFLETTLPKEKGEDQSTVPEISSWREIGQDEAHLRDSGLVDVKQKGSVYAQADVATGRLVTLNGFEIQQDLRWYNASDGNTEENHGQASGAYIFRPNSTTTFPLKAATSPATSPATSDDTSTVSTWIVEGEVVSEIHQVFADWGSLTTRMYSETDHFEQEWIVGPIPVDDGNGKEVILRTNAGIASEGVFFTDANGRDMQERKVDFRPSWDLNTSWGYNPVAGNYYPINAVITVRDENLQLAMVTDRAQGGSSLRPGSLEVMLHRRLLRDDGRGVAEALMETACNSEGEETVCEGITVKGKFLVSIGHPSKAASVFRTLQQKARSPLVLSFAKVCQPFASELEGPTFSLVQAPLPANLHLLTMQSLKDSVILLRVAHLYEAQGNAGWDENLSQDAEFNICTLFPDRKILSIEERTLSGNQEKHKKDRMQWNIFNENKFDDYGTPASKDFGPKRNKVRCNDSNSVVKIHAMEIKTFYVTLA